MGPEKSLFTMALGPEAPCYVDDVSFDASTKHIDFEVTFKPGSRFECPSCGAVDRMLNDIHSGAGKLAHAYREHRPIDVP